MYPKLRPILSVTSALKLNLPYRARQYHLFGIGCEVRCEYMDGEYSNFLFLATSL